MRSSNIIQGSSDRTSLFMKPMSLNKKFMHAQGKSKLEDPAKNHPFLSPIANIIAEDIKEKVARNVQRTSLLMANIQSKEIEGFKRLSDLQRHGS